MIRAVTGQVQPGPDLLPVFDRVYCLLENRQTAALAAAFHVVPHQLILAAVEFLAVQVKAGDLGGRRPVSRRTTYAVRNIALTASKGSSP